MTDNRLLKTSTFDLLVYSDKFAKSGFDIFFQHKYWYLWSLTIRLFRWQCTIELCRRDWHASYRVSDIEHYRQQVAEDNWQPVPDKLFRKWVLRHMSEAVEAFNASNDVDEVLTSVVNDFYNNRLSKLDWLIIRHADKANSKNNGC